MITIFLILLITTTTIFLLLSLRTTKTSSSSTAAARNLPPGSLGVPFIGQSLSLLRAMRSNSAERWLQQRVAMYGPVSKMTLFGKPTVFVKGTGANKAVVFSSEEGAVSNAQTESLKRILGERNLTELSGEDHKRVRGAVVWFLRPQNLKEFVGKMDGEVRKHLSMYWNGNNEVTVLPLVKTLIFDIICSLLFGIEEGPRRKSIIGCFKTMVDGVWSVPINLPFTRYSNSLKASAKVQQMLKQLLKEKRQKLEEEEKEEGDKKHKDIITYLLSIKKNDKEQALSEDEIVHNIIILMIAGYDTTTILITLMVRVLATNPTIYADVLREHEEIARSKECGEALTWEDVSKMKYTWRVALETLRLFPPVFGGFRVALKDIQFGGYTIPKGWQIFWAASMTHLDETIFADPEKFEPSRFEKQTSIPPLSFIGFGGGPRICPGNEFAKLETLVTIHYLITQFTWKLTSEDFLTRDPTLMPNKGLPIQLYPK